MTRETSIQPPWWLETGPVECDFCLHRYHSEAMYYCVACDRPVCPVCVIERQATRTLVCPDCHAEDDCY